MNNKISLYFLIIKLLWLVSVIIIPSFSGLISKNLSYAAIIGLYVLWAYLLLMVFYFRLQHRLYIYEDHTFEIFRVIVWVWIKYDGKKIMTTNALKIKEVKKLNYAGYDLTFSYGITRVFLDLFINGKAIKRAGIFNK